MNENGSPYLPLDLQLEILSGLPTESVIRFRRVCKDWNSHTRHDAFVHSHHSKCVRTHNTPNFVFENDVDGRCFFGIGRPNSHDKRPPDFTPLVSFSPIPSSECGTRLITSCEGLLCFVKTHHITGYKSVYLCNPFLRESMKLPELHVREVKVLGVGFDPLLKQFKVLISSFYSQPNALVSVCTVSVGIEVSRSNWRDIGECPTFRPHVSSPVSLQGRIHWCLVKEDQNYNLLGPTIMSFDLHDEIFYEWSLEELNLPRWTNSKPTFCCGKMSYVLGEMQGCLVLLMEECKAGRGFLRVWVMEDHGNNNSWNLNFSFDLGVNNCPISYPLGVDFFCYGTSDQTFWVCYWMYVMCYESRNKSSDLLILGCGDCDFANAVQIMPFVGSLVSLKGSLNPVEP